MHNLTRRFFLISSALSAVLAGKSAVANGSSALPPPAMAGGMPLLDALAARRSIRLYDERPIDEDMLSTLLWAAFGINRPDIGGHTAPSWRTSMETDIYVADAKSVRKYDPSRNEAGTVLQGDFRARASTQPFVGTAPVVLIYIADRARMAKAPDADQIQAAHVDSAIVAQNVYLYCASVGLGTCLVGGADKKALTEILKLPESQIVTFVQPVGHPKQ